MMEQLSDIQNPPLTRSGNKLPLVEAFYTLQGEGHFAGTPAWFIRLGGCDVGCVWCDTKDSWDAGTFPEVEVAELAEQAAASGAPLAVITGGEPLMHELTPLTRALKRHGLRTHLETSGAHPLTGLFDWICLSPKKFKTPVQDIFPRADALKVVAYHRSDFDWATQLAQRVRPGCRLFLQPEWSRRSRMTPAIIDFIKRSPRWQISLQLHKYLDIP